MNSNIKVYTVQIQHKTTTLMPSIKMTKDAFAADISR